MSTPTPVPPVAPKAELKLVPIDEPVTLSVEPVADKPSATLTIAGDDDTQKKPAIAIDDQNATTTIDTSLPAPAVVTKQEAADTELEANPDNPTPNPGDVRSSDKELGPTWFDALLLAIRSGTMLFTNIIEKGINEGNAWYKDHYTEINATINNFFEPITGKLRNVQTILEAHPELQAHVVKSAEDILAGLQATLKNETLSEADRTAIMKQIQDLEATLKDAPKLSPPETLEEAEATTTPSPSTTVPKPSGPSEAEATETPAEKTAREAADAKAKPPITETTPAINPVLEATSAPTQATMPSLSSTPKPLPPSTPGPASTETPKITPSISTPIPSHVQTNAETPPELIKLTEAQKALFSFAEDASKMSATATKPAVVPAHDKAMAAALAAPMPAAIQKTPTLVSTTTAPLIPGASAQSNTATAGPQESSHRQSSPRP